ncbi:hypothetical protein [Parapontixanthobacter aurantiacus]|nr:hypothetical protein [Parapontixanthobacter aurantiacus]
METQSPVSLWVTGGMAAAFVAVHVLIGRLTFLDRTPRSAWLSFSGGVAVAYVFLHILPELASHGEIFASALRLEDRLAEAWVYALALTGLALFYGVERAVTVSRSDQRAKGEGDRPESGVFWVHLVTTGSLVAIISYLLNHREDMSASGLAVFFVAMVLHFMTADYGARANHPELYERYGRWVLALASLGGWLLGTLVALPEFGIACLFAFLGGGIILVVMKEELPAERQSRFFPFLIGTVLYAMLVIGETYLVGG